ncbi:MAG TPA: CBS domain-containing protein [Bacteroidia bacterium]|jgi:pentose-5-phosphate-3-epimerase/CBS domain-containing protein|nr:CBS domain-containing protein [Bacteroidia bacterium]
MKISASIYSTTRDLKEVVADLDAHRIDLFHVDCNDDPKVFDDIEKIRQWSKTPVDLHIISKTPEKYFPLLEKTPVDYVTFQYEDLPGKLNVPSTIKGKLGLAITAVSDIDVFDQYAGRFDFILMMATIPGKSGGEFNTEIFRKIRMFRKKYPEKRIHVDGGVNGEVSFILRNMGVYASVSGSYLFKANTVGSALLNLKTHENESHFLVKDFMMTNGEIPVLKPSERSFENILRSIEDYALGFTILADEKNKLQGIISNADVRKGMLKKINSLNSIGENDLVNRTPVTVNENATVKELLRLIKSKKFPIMYLPVVDNENKVTGALTFFNLVKGEA